MNGQYCYAGDAVIRRQPIAREDLRTLLKMLEEDPFPCLFVERDGCFINFSDELVERANAMANLPEAPVGDPRRALETDIFQLNFFLPPGREEEVLRRLPGCAATRWSPYFSDIVPVDGSKRVGVAKMLDHFGLTPGEAMAFGDGENDIEMLQLAGVGVAMGNASDTVKAAADYVTAGVDEDGVLKALKHFSIIP